MEENEPLHFPQEMLDMFAEISRQQDEQFRLCKTMLAGFKATGETDLDYMDSYMVRRSGKSTLCYQVLHGKGVKYSQKSKLRTVQEKVYTVDVAMMDQRDNAFAGDNLGHRLETIVAIHLHRLCKLSGLDVYYLNERSGECDFVVCKGNQVVQAIQVSYDISAEKTRRREVNGLRLAAEQTKCQNLLLLTDHESGEIEESGFKMKVQPVYEWALESGV